ncbi:hypothetical protein GRJ2_002153300 [Grus japonensis]|uniref:Uncharacterized protein n=1 Tax=Grus japonensis TaxID=30415 RepID=A0ABC9XGS0_GRUJA
MKNLFIDARGSGGSEEVAVETAGEAASPGSRRLPEGAAPGAPRRPCPAGREQRRYPGGGPASCSFTGSLITEVNS